MRIDDVFTFGRGNKMSSMRNDDLCANVPGKAAVVVGLEDVLPSLSPPLLTSSPPEASAAMTESP